MGSVFGRLCSSTGAPAVDMSGPNEFERTISIFNADPQGYGSRKFTDCTLLHKKIAENDLDFIMARKDWLTEKALNIRGVYDKWQDVSPLWMVVAFHGSRWMELIKLMIKNGASVNNVPDVYFGRSNMPLNIVIY